WRRMRTVVDAMRAPPPGRLDEPGEPGESGA
ncbi:twitching motility protein PilT, partial [Burkholderia cepacia]|nr:twitching motility protein PilT [Burkholderia cepacia]